MIIIIIIIIITIFVMGTVECIRPLSWKNNFTNLRNSEHSKQHSFWLSRCLKIWNFKSSTGEMIISEL